MMKQIKLIVFGITAAIIILLAQDMLSVAEGFTDAEAPRESGTEIFFYSEVITPEHADRALSENEETDVTAPGDDKETDEPKESATPTVSPDAEEETPDMPESPSPSETPTATPSATPTETPTATPTATPEEKPTVTPPPADETELDEVPHLDQEEQEPATQTDLKSKKKSKRLRDKDFVIEYKDTEVVIGGSSVEVVEEMIDEDLPVKIQDGRKTILTPPGKSYENENITIITNGEDKTNAEIINALFVEGEGIKTSRGIGVGDSKQLMLKKYGKPQEEISDLVLYYVETEDGYKSIVFQIEPEDDTVFSYALLNQYPLYLPKPKK